MQHLVYNISALPELTEWLNALPADVKNKRILAGVYSSLSEEKWFTDVRTEINSYLPTATVTGGNCPATIDTSVNEQNHTQISLMIFDSSWVQGYSIPAEQSGHKSYESGENLADRLLNEAPLRPSGVMLLFSPTMLDVSDFYAGLYAHMEGIPVFGAGVGGHPDIHKVIMMLDKNILTSGFIAIAFYGKSLRLESTHHLGWIPFGEVMTITSAQDNVVDSINHRSAAQLYNHFIGFDNDDFFSHAMEFPFIVRRNGINIARVPFAVTDQQQMTFVADIRRGDQVQFAYGDINSIMENLDFFNADMKPFQPEAVLTFSCVSRLSFLNGNPNLEVSPYLNQSNAGGFFSYGEIDSSSGQDNVLNATIVSIAFSETPASTELSSDMSEDLTPPVTSSRDLARLKRLMYFISRVTEDLQKANRELRNISQKDALTGIYNRRALTTKLKQELSYAREGGLPISVIMIDLDHFKYVNDDHGHLVGDRVITASALIIASCIRPGDFLARFGGEEFMLILPATNAQDAAEVAERIRKTLESQTRTMDIPSVTCSLGVACDQQGKSSSDELIHRSDQALYQAKSNGRNQVFTAPQEV